MEEKDKNERKKEIKKINILTNINTTSG